MKSICLILSLFGFALIQSCTNRCCPDDMHILEESINFPKDSMPTKYWFIQNGDSVLIDFRKYKTDEYYIPSSYTIDCSAYYIPNWNTCEMMIKVNTYSLYDTDSSRVLQFHVYPYYSGPELSKGAKIKLTLRSSSFKNDVTVFEDAYYDTHFNEVNPYGTNYNRVKVKSIDFSNEKGLKKLELHEGLVIYAAD